MMSTRYAKHQPTGFTNKLTKAGGQIGRHILAALLDKDSFIITAIQRPSSTSPLPAGIHVIKAPYGGEPSSSDTTSSSSSPSNANHELISALRGQQALLITMSVLVPQDTVVQISRAAAAAGVQFVFPNWIGHDDASLDLCRDSFLLPTAEKLKAEFAKFAGTTSYIFLVCGFWYEFSLGGGPERFGFDFKKKALTWFDDGEATFNVTTWPQCGRAVAAVMGLKILPEDEEDEEATISGFGNKSVYVSSFRINQREIFESVKRVTGTRDEDWEVSRESARRRWEENAGEVRKGNFGSFPKMLYSRMFFPGGEGDFESRRGTDNKILGLPVEELDEFTRIAVKMGEEGEVSTHH